MFRWETVDDKEIFGMTVKMYRDPFVPVSSERSLFFGLELDHFAYKHFESELFMYRILDTNFEEYMEERGDMNRVENVYIPVDSDSTRTVY